MYLNTHSYYSLRYGTRSPEELAQVAAKMGAPAMALTDINNSSAIVDWVRETARVGIKPIAGIDFHDGDRHLYVGLARNNEGFRELNEFLSTHLIAGTPLPDTPPVLPHVYFIYPFGEKAMSALRENEFLGVRPEQLNRVQVTIPQKEQNRLVALQPATFAGPDDFELHRHLRAIHHNTLLSKLTPEQLGKESDCFRPWNELQQLYSEFPEIRKATQRLLDNCEIHFDFKENKNKKTFTGNLNEDIQLLEKLALEGCRYRYGNNEKARQRVSKELKVIHDLGFSAYFLIAWDIIRYSMSRGFYHVGRGSGANSIVAYCLKITDVDPIQLNLYFERFINPKRTSPPDFDIDFSWRDRDEIQRYIFERYGWRHTALLGTINTFQGKSILRELGKVYGLPKTEIDELIENPEKEVSESKLYRHIFSIGSMMQDFPNLRSIHAGGILISEEPITCYTALDLPPKGLPTTQWDMYVAEDLRFEKLDILSQRGIGHINDSVEIIRANWGEEIDIHRVNDFMRDAQTRKQLKVGETIGCFYIESPAMRGLLKKLRCDNYLTLVAASSIIRPGVAKSGMMREYIHRFHHPDNFHYLHPVMKEQLEETYGVMVYQEDVLKVCHHFAGLDLADADILRRAMSGKYRSKSEFQRIVDRFFSNSRELGRPPEIVKEVWRQIESFAGYSFSKAHSASYAVESYQSLYLKAHYPLEFTVAVINNFGGFYRTWVYVNEARRCGGNIQPPCVNRSKINTSIYGRNIFLGFNLMNNLEHKLQQEIIQERERAGEFKSMEQFVARLKIGMEQLILLIRIGAFRFTGKPKMQLLWEAHMLLGKKQPSRPHQLFEIQSKEWELPQLSQTMEEAAYDEIELLGFPVTCTWFDLLETKFRGEVMARDLMNNVVKTVRMIGTLVTIKYVRTVRNETMHFGSFLDVTGEFFETTHFPPLLKRWPFRGAGVYLMMGKVVEEFGHPSIEVEKLAKLPLKKDPRR